MAVKLKNHDDGRLRIRFPVRCRKTNFSIMSKDWVLVCIYITKLFIFKHGVEHYPMIMSVAVRRFSNT